MAPGFRSGAFLSPNSEPERLAHRPHGTLYVEDAPIAGAREALSRLEAAIRGRQHEYQRHPSADKRSVRVRVDYRRGKEGGERVGRGRGRLPHLLDSQDG